MTLQEIVSGFNTTPFLFAGSGVSRRYYNLPDWIGLLTTFARKLKKDEYAFQSYESKVSSTLRKEDRMPVVATLIEQDFNLAWFENAEGLRSGSEVVYDLVSSGVSPFKAELAEYLKSISVDCPEYRSEIEKLKRISKKSISGIITTNYDNFFEKLFDGYKVFVGQEELVFSQLQGFAEIYKIHGSVDFPPSIIINENDYRSFREKGKYIAAKLMTIFMEYPIIFIGYSISDADIQMILSDIVECLPRSKLSLLRSRFVFVEYDSGAKNAEVASHSMMIDGKPIEMTKITLSDFGILYDALGTKRAALPVKLLRRFKDDLYTFALTNEPGPLLQVAPLDDKRINEETLALTIGLAQTGRLGLARAFNSEQWYRNIVLHDALFPIDDLLELVYPDLSKQNSWKLPVWYYLKNSKKGNALAEERAPRQYTDIVSKESIERGKVSINNRTALQIWREEKSNRSRALRILGNLPEERMDSSELRDILEEIFSDDHDVLKHLQSQDRSNLHRLIRIYDFMEFGQKKTP